MQGIPLELEAHQVICHEGDPYSDLYLLQSGRVLICTLNGTQVKVIARIFPGEFIGELSFFDGKPRSSYAVTLDKCKLLQIPKQEFTGLLPKWFSLVGANLTKKIRLLDQVISERQVRRTSEETKPLSQDEQRIFHELLTKQDS